MYHVFWLNSKASKADRRSALKTLASKEHHALKDRLVNLLNDSNLSNDSIVAMASYDEKSFSRELLSRYSLMNVEEKSATIKTLASQALWRW